MEFTPNSKHGVLIRPPSGKDYVAGINSPLITASDVLPSGDWRPFVPVGEKQSKVNGTDTDDCTGYSYTNVLEMWIKFLKAHNLLNANFDMFLKTNGYYDANGEVNFSERALGSMAGTTSNGNYLDKVANTARTMGLVPESKWSSDPNLITQTGDAFYAEYYKPVPPDLVALAVQILQYIDLPYQAVPNGLFAAPAGLKQGPMYIALCTCGGWSTDHPVNWCNAGDATNHAVVLVCIDGSGFRYIFDSYPPYTKQLNKDYNIPFLMQVFLIQKKGVKKMQGFKLATDATVYIQISNGILIPIANWDAFVELGGSSDSVITLTPEQLAKFTVVKDVFLKK